MQEAQVRSLDWDDPLGKGMATHSNILVWRVPWTEEPGGLQSMGSQKESDMAEQLTNNREHMNVWNTGPGLGEGGEEGQGFVGRRVSVCAEA